MWKLKQICVCVSGGPIWQKLYFDPLPAVFSLANIVAFVKLGIIIIVLTLTT